MEHEGSGRPPRYEGEDVSPTTERELRGWYCTGLAAEVFAVCGVGSFAPVTLEQLARERGVLRADGTPCVPPPAAFPSIATRGIRHIGQHLAFILKRDDGDGQCIVHPFGRATSTAGFAMYTFSIAVFVQALVLISFSSVADYGIYRKRLLMCFAFTGATSTMLFLLVVPELYVFGALLIIVGVVCLGSSFVLLNSFLPLLAINYPNTQRREDSIDQPHADTQIRGLPAPSKATSGSPELKVATRVSSKGVGLGYASAVSVQVLSILLLVLLKKTSASQSTSLRFVLFTVGVCWAVLTVPGALWLKARPGPTLRVGRTWKSRLPVFVQYFSFAWGSVWQTAKTTAKLRQTLVFLVAWFILSDAVATVSGTAILFARIELHMGTIAIALLSITVTTSGIAGAFFWPLISKRFDWQSKTTIIACVSIMETIPLYGLLGFLPFIKAMGAGGLQQAWEIYPLGVVYGFVMGGLSSYCRAFYGEIIPPGSEAAFFALYAITDKGSSAIGPAIVGAIVDTTGTIRPAFGFLAVLVALPIPLIYIVDVGKGRADALGLSKHIGQRVDQGISMVDYDLAGDSEAAEGLISNVEDDET